MKTTTWLCPVLILLCATKLVYTAQRGASYGGYPLDDMDSNMLQNDYFLSKRNKPSLSIVNPLDVLRQRLLLEIARRQMKENTRQVELNRAILKNVGKRMLSKHPYPLASALLNIQESQQQLQQEPMQQQPYEMELIPTTLIFDYLQQQQQQEQQQQQQHHQQRRPWLPAIQFENNDFNDANEDVDVAVGGGDEDDNNVNGMGNDNIAHNDIFGNNNEKHSMKHMKQSNDDHATSSSSSTSSLTNANEHETTFKKPFNRNNDTKRLNVLNHEHFLQKSTKDDNNNVGDNDNSAADAAAADADYQVQRYLYHLHKNHLTRK